MSVLIKEYRDSFSIRWLTEDDLRKNMCRDYDKLLLPNKVEIFRAVMENTRGEDL